MEAKAVESVKKLEEQLAAARETARAALMQGVEDNLAQLRAIGFDYDLVTHQNGAAPSVKRGRPRKEEPVAKEN
jgi:hypothetical protein